MAALLRSAKFLRIVTGLTRQQVNQQQPIPGPTVASSDGGAGANALPPVSGGGFEGHFQTWSLQHIQAVLPALGAATVSKEDEPDGAKPAAGILQFLAAEPAAEGEEAAVDVGERREPERGLSFFKTEKLQLSSKAAAEAAVEAPAAAAVCAPDVKVEAEDGVNARVVVSEVSPSPQQEEVASVKSDGEDRPEAVPVVAPQMVPVVPVIGSRAETEWYPLPVVCQMFRQQGRYWDLECLLEGSKGIRPEDRKVVYFWTLQAYADAGLFDRAVALSGQLYAEGLGYHFPEYHHLMGSFAAGLNAVAQQPSAAYTLPLPPRQLTPSTTTTEASLVSSPPGSPAPHELRRVRAKRRSSKADAAAAAARCQALQRKLKKALGERNVGECLRVHRELLAAGLGGKALNVTDMSAFIEMLVREDLVKEATGVAESMLANDVYPMPKIFRFLLNRLASMGDVASVTAVGGYLTSRVKKEVSFDNRLCNAYLAAGRGAEYLGLLLEELSAALEESGVGGVSAETAQSLKDRFPRGGAMGLLESNPGLVGSYTELAHKFLELGYVAPMNVLWTYHFIGGRHDLADALWEKYVKNCPQIMFQKVCQTSRARSNADLAQRLVNLLESASTVTVGAKGIAYSCLLDVLTQRREYSEGVKALRRGLESGVKIEDVNRTALKRLKEGLEATSNEKFPFQIPKKSVACKIAAAAGKADSAAIRVPSGDDDDDLVVEEAFSETSSAVVSAAN